MKPLTVPFMLLLCSYAAAQDPKVTLYDSDWKSAKPKKASFLVEQQQRNDTCWEWNYYVWKGPRFLSAQFKDAKGKIMHGDYVTYTDDGYIDTSGTYHNGRKDGEWYVNASNHRTLYRLTYKDGALLSRIDSIQLNQEHKRKADSLYTEEKVIIEIESEFVGGFKAWQQYINKNLQYPRQSMDNNVQGAVHVRFIVNQEGKVEIAELYKSAEYYLDKEALRLIAASPTWTPASRDGQPVKSYKRQPIHFALSD